VHGDFRLMLRDDQQVFAYVRTLDDTRLLVIANLSSQPATIDLADDADLLTGTLLIASLPVLADSGNDLLTLRPWEARVHLLG
jgi:hypothetical protein